MNEPCTSDAFSSNINIPRVIMVSKINFQQGDWPTDHV